MKIEKLNENQFRCTVTLGELLQRHLTLKKLSAGGGDAKRLVREMIELSENEVGFEPNDLPVRVEAMPTPEGNLIFTITKVNSLEELNPGGPQESLVRALQFIAQALHQQEEERTRRPEPLAVFCYDEKTGVQLPPTLQKTPAGIHSALYHVPKAHVYYLLIHTTQKHAEAFAEICLLLSEYARMVPSATATKAYFDERYVTVYGSRAIEQLSEKAGG
ncbi:MAG: adaptor protein MecA [Lachnospiraceae bacterium]|nr:adaptor protein MecA [Lachnospiraceae bacterium]